MSKEKTSEELQQEQEKTEKRIHYLENEGKRLRSTISTLNRKERTHRLCTRGGMLEGFLGKPNDISDEQVYELLKIAFRQDEVKTTLSLILQSIPEMEFDDEIENTADSP